MKIWYVNFRKEYPASFSADAFRSWLSLRRYWGGRLIYLCFRHRALAFDFRKDFLSDLTDGRLTLRKRRQEEEP